MLAKATITKAITRPFIIFPVILFISLSPLPHLPYGSYKLSLCILPCDFAVEQKMSSLFQSVVVLYITQVLVVLWAMPIACPNSWVTICFVICSRVYSFA